MGEPDPDTLLRSIPGPLLTEWMGYWGVRVTDTERLLAELCALFYNANRADGARSLAPHDFLARLRQVRRRDPKDVEKKLRFWAGIMSAKVPES